MGVFPSPGCGAEKAPQPLVIPRDQLVELGIPACLQPESWNSVFTP